MLFKPRRAPVLAEKIRNWIWPRMGLARATRYHWLRLIRISATPHSIGLGTAVGVFMGFSPFVGAHMLSAALICLAIGGNAIAAALGTMVCNPISCPIMLIGDFQIGSLILHHTGLHAFGIPDRFTAVFVGWIILGSGFAVPTYFLTRRAVGLMRMRRSERLARRREQQQGLLP